MYSVGIDFGTTNSAVGTFVSGMPTTVSFSDGGLETDWQQFPHFERLAPSVFSPEPGGWTFGWRAKLAGSNPILAVKRLLRNEAWVSSGGTRYPTEVVAGALFRGLAAGCESVGVDFSSAVVTIPSNSAGRARYLTRRCAALGGIAVRALMSEPSAAALRYGFGAPADRRMLVFDFGGGTLDVTVVDQEGGSFRERVSRGVPRLGGVDLDREVLELLKAKVSNWHSWSQRDRRTFELEAEKTKIRLSWTDEVAAREPDGAVFAVSRAELERVVSPLVERSLEPLRAVLDSVGGGESIDELLLVGGTTQIPRVRELVQEVVGRPAVGYADLNPMTAVAEGAALAHAILSGKLPGHDFTFVLEHALGLRAYVRADDAFRFIPIIDAGAPLPASETKFFLPKNDIQASQRATISLEVWEGQPDKGFDDECNVRLDTVPLVIRGPRARTDAGVDVTFSYDIDGLISISGIERSSGDVVFDRSIELAHALTQEEIDSSIEQLDNLGAPDAGKPEDPEADIVFPDAVPDVAALVVDGSSLALPPGLQQPSPQHLESALQALAGRFGGVQTWVFVDRDFLERLTSADRPLADRAIAENRWTVDRRADTTTCLVTAAGLAARRGASLVTNASAEDIAAMQREFPAMTADRMLYADFDNGTWAFRSMTERS